MNRYGSEVTIARGRNNLHARFEQDERALKEDNDGGALVGTINLAACL